MLYYNDIPEGYTNVAEISDNYLVWVRETTLLSGRSYSAYIQYINPSVTGFLIDNYMISSGTNYEFTSSDSGESYQLSYSLSTCQVDSDYLSGSDFDRGDMPLIFVCQFICCLFFVWMLNQLSKLFKKDGVFH